MQRTLGWTKRWMGGKMSEWLPIDTIPRDRAVEIESVAGEVCPARVHFPEEPLWIRKATVHYPRRVNCIRLDKPTQQSISAVRWRCL